MRIKKWHAIALTVISLVLITVQFVLWAHTAAHESSETQMQNKEIQHPPDELPGVAGISLLMLAGILAMLPATEN